MSASKAFVRLTDLISSFKSAISFSNCLANSAFGSRHDSLSWAEFSLAFSSAMSCCWAALTDNDLCLSDFNSSLVLSSLKLKKKINLVKAALV